MVESNRAVRVFLVFLVFSAGCSSSDVSESGLPPKDDAAAGNPDGAAIPGDAGLDGAVGADAGDGGGTQAAGDNVHWTILQASGPVPNQTGVSANYRFGGQFQPGNPPSDIMANYDTSGKSTDCWDHSKERAPLNQWVCYAWRFAGATNELELTLDGKDVADA